MVYNTQNHRVSGLCLSFGILRTREHNVSRVPRGQRDGFLRPDSRLSRPKPLSCLPSNSSILLTSGPHSGLSTSQKVW
jgi:hypothetical protein